MYLAVAREAEEAVGTGFFIPSHSTDGARSFETSESGSGPAQCVEGLGGGRFAITGSTAAFNGVAMSRDGGRTFPEVYDGVFGDSTPARYGAFSTARDGSETWYVAGGSWPSNENSASNGALGHSGWQKA